MKSRKSLKMNTTICLIFLPLLGCSTGTVKITSMPEKAEVFIGYDGAQPTKLGETPLSLEGEHISRKKGSFLTLLIKKEGYQTESAILPTSYISSDLTFTSKLEDYKLTQQCADATQAIQKISRGTANVQYMVKSHRLVEALQQVDDLIREFPGVSVLYDLRGNILYLNKDLAGALNAYERSLELDPTNSDTSRMRLKLRGILGERAPAARGGP